MKVQEILKDWSSLNEAIMGLSEAELEKLKAAEQSGENRLSYLSRIQGRINKVRSRRESAEILQG